MERLLLTQRLEIELVQKLEIAFSCRAAPAAVPHASPYQWANACHDLFEAGRLDVLGHSLRYLQALYPELTYLAAVRELLDAIPCDLPPPLAFCDDPAAEIEIVARADSDQVLLCFCATNGTLGLPLNFVHQWLGRLPVSLVYIKDFRDLCGGCGYPTLGPDRASAVAALDRLVRGLGGKRIYTLGVSLGGYPALYYGLALEAVAVLNLAGATDLTPAFVASLAPIQPAYRKLCRLAPDYAVSLRDSYHSAANPPRVLIAYNRGNPRDRRQAERMAGLPNVELIAADHGQHDVVGTLIREKRFLRLLHRLVGLEAGDAGSARAETGLRAEDAGGGRRSDRDLTQRFGGVLRWWRRRARQTAGAADGKRSGAVARQTGDRIDAGGAAADGRGGTGQRAGIDR